VASIGTAWELREQLEVSGTCKAFLGMLLGFALLLHPEITLQPICWTIPLSLAEDGRPSPSWQMNWTTR